MANFFARIFGRNNNKGSGAEARDRLQFILVHDRISISPELLRAMKKDILDVIVRYMPEVDQDSVDLVVEQNDRNSNMIVAQIPFTKPPSGTLPAGKPEGESFSQFNAELDPTAEMETMSYELEPEDDEEGEGVPSDEDTLPNRRPDDLD